MAVIIDIDLPNRCDECPLVLNDECPLIGIDVDEEMESRDLNCPLKEVPTGKLEKDIKALQNRCFALSGGTLCFACPMDCDRRNAPHRGVVEEQQGETT